jgi:hypothetical protein
VHLRPASPEGRGDDADTSSALPRAPDVDATATWASPRTTTALAGQRQTERREQRPISRAKLRTRNLPLQRVQLVARQEDLDLPFRSKRSFSGSSSSSDQ